MSARRTRSSGFLKGLLPVALWLAAVAGVWAWLASSPVRGLDAAVYSFWSELWGIGEPAGKPLLLGPKEAPPVRRVPHTVKEVEYPEVAVLHLEDEQVSSHFHKAPIQPLDLAVLLDAARKSGFTHLGISSPFAWPSPCDSLVEETLRRKMQAFSSVVLGLRGRTASRPEFTPAELAGSALDPSRVEGSIALLPSANAALPRSLSADSFGPWGIDWIENEDLMDADGHGEASYPLLVRWHGDIYPTLPLRLMMLAEGVALEELQVKVGSHIAWREKILPIDSYGRTTLDSNEKVRRLPISSVMEPPQAAAGSEQAGRYLVVEEPVALHKESPERVEWMAATLSRLACRVSERTEWEERSKEGFVLRRVGAGWGVAVSALLAAFVFLQVAPRLPGWLHFTFALILIAMGGIALCILMSRGGWVLIAPWLAALVVLLAASHLLRLRQPRRRR